MHLSNLLLQNMLCKMWKLSKKNCIVSASHIHDACAFCLALCALESYAPQCASLFVKLSGDKDGGYESSPCSNFPPLWRIIHWPSVRGEAKMFLTKQKFFTFTGVWLSSEGLRMCSPSTKFWSLHTYASAVSMWQVTTLHQSRSLISADHLVWQ